MPPRDPSGLAAVLVGNVPASQIYVRNKVKTCETLGIASDLITPPESVTTEEMFDLVEDLTLAMTSTEFCCSFRCQNKSTQKRCSNPCHRKKMWMDFIPSTLAGYRPDSLLSRLAHLTALSKCSSAVTSPCQARMQL